MARRGMREGVAAKCTVKGVGPQLKGTTAMVGRAPESPFMGLALVDDWTKPRSTTASIEEGEHLGLLALQRRGRA